MSDAKMSSLSLEQRRPLSPHLEVYKPLLTMMMSITHRITGMALYAGALLVVWFVLALAAGPSAFHTVSVVYGSWIGQIILFLFTWAFFQHLLGGVRHFVWDAGFGMDHPQREWLAQMSAIGGISLAVLVWIIRFVI